MRSSTSIGNISRQTTDRWNFNFTDHPHSETTDPWWISIIYINLFLYILSVIGNGILVAVFSKNAQMRTTTNMLVVSHLMAELLASSVGIATHLSALLVERPFATSTWCMAGTSAVKFCMGGGFLSLVGISVDRYLAVVKKVHHKVTKLRVQIFLIVIWTLSIGYGIPWHLIFHAGPKWNYVGWLIVNCRVKITEGSTPYNTAADIFRYSFLVIVIVLPFFTIAFTSHRILCTALKTRRRVGIIGTSVNHVAAAYIKSAFTTIIIVSVYFLCLLPTLAVGAKCKNRYWKCKHEWLLFFAKVTLCFRSACFPVIYAIRGRNFSKYIRQFLYKRVEICRKYLNFDRNRGSRKVSVYHCSSSHTGHERGATHGRITVTGNLGQCTFDKSRKVAFVDLEKHTL